MQVLHAYTLTQADGTATSVVRPTDWNSGHNIAYNLSGNTAGSSQVSGTNVVFVGGNGVTLSADTANSRIAFSAANQTQQPMAFSAGGASTTANTIQFGNSNGLSFGLSNGSVTASYTVPSVPAQTYQPVAFSAEGGSSTASTLNFANSNGLSFSNSNGSIVASYTVPVQTVQPVAYSAANGSAAFSTLPFANSNGVSFSTGTQGLYATVKTDYLTTAALSNHSHGNPTLALTNLTGTTASNSAGLTLSISAAAQSAQPVAVSGSNGSFAFSTLSMGALNGLSFYTSNGSVVGSYTVPNVPAQTVQPVAVSGSNGSFAFSTLSLGNLNGVSFYTSNGSVVASYTVPSQTVQPVAYSAANGSALFSTLAFANSNGVSFSTGTQGVYATVKTDYLTTAALSDHSHGNPTLALTNLTGTTASNSAGLTLSISGNAAQTVQPVAISGSNGSFAFSTLSLGALNGLSFYTSNGSVVASYTVPSQTVQTQNMVSVLGSTGNISFANGNGITFGGNASTITASHNGLTTARASNDAIGLNTALTGNGVVWTVNSSGLSLSVPAFLTTAALSNHSHGNPTLALTNLTGTTASNSAGLTLSLSGNAAQTVQPVAISGSNGSFVFSTLSMGNLNGVSFYTSNGSVVASYTVPTQTVQPVAYSAANGSALFSTLPFANSNGVSFSTGTQGLYATVKTDYLTTAALSDHSHGNPTLALTNLTGTTASNSAGFTLSLSAAAGGGGADGYNIIGINGNSVGSAATVQFSNSNNVSFGLNGSTVTASASFPAQTVQPVAYSGANGSALFSTLSFANSNGVSFSTGTQGLYATVQTNFLTTAALSNHSHGNPTLALTNLTGTTASNSAGLTLSLSGNAAQTVQPVAISGSNGSFAYSTLSMGNLNGVSFYTSNGSVVASYTVPNVPAQTVQPVAYSGANGSALFSTLSFANSNGVSFSTGTQGLYATVKTDYLTTAALSDHSHGNPTLALTNLSGTTASNSAGFTLSLSAAAGGGGGNTADTFSFVGNTTGTSSGTMAQSAMVISAAGALTGGWSASSIILSAPVVSSLVAVGNVSLSTNGNTISISGYGAGTGYTSTTQAGSTVGVTQNTNGMSLAWPPFITTQTVQTQASGNIARTGYTSTTQAGSTVGATLNTSGLSMAWPPFITTYVAQTNQTVASGNIAGIGTTFAGTNISASITFNSVGLNLALSGQGGGVVNQTGPNIAVAGSTITSGTVVFSNANGVTFGLNGQTLTASAAGGGGAPDRRFKEVIQGERLTTLVGLSATNVSNRAMFLPFWMEGTGLAANTARLMMSFGASSNRSLGGTFHLGLYMQNNDTQMTLLTSNSWSASSTATSATSAWNGVAWVDFGLGGYTISSEGRYILALQVNPVSANVTWMPVSLYGADPMPAQSRVILNGTTQALSSNSQFVPFWGVYSTTSGGLPNSVGLTQINGASSQFQMQYYAALREI